MRFPSPLLPGRLIRRYQRFLADVRLSDGRVVTAHCPNPGSMLGCLVADGPVLLSETDDPSRRLRYTLELVRLGRHWAGVNTLRTNRVVEEALRRGRLPEFTGYPDLRAEAPLGHRRRADFLLSAGVSRLWVEVKNVTLVRDRRALFPDSVTERGAAHLRELAARVREGDRAAMLYLVNRGDADRAGPARDIDPTYARELERALAAGVEAVAYRAKVGPRGIAVADRLPFDV